MGPVVSRVAGRPPAGSGGTRGALVMAVIGALLIFFQSLGLVFVGALVPALTWGDLGLSFGVLGWFGILVALLLVALSVWLYSAPEQHLILGVGMLTLAVLSLYSGGGLILGFLLSYVGSLLAIFARPPTAFRGAVPILSPQAQDDPVVEADLIDSGFAPQPAPAPGPGPR